MIFRHSSTALLTVLDVSLVVRTANSARHLIARFRPGAFGLPARGERFFALRTLRSSADFGTARSRLMTVLKCVNSGCASNSSAVSGSGRFSSRAPVSCASIGPSAIRNTLLDFAGQLLVGNAAANNLLHDGAKPFRIRQGAVVVPETLFIQVPEQMERLHADVSPVSPRFKRLQKFSIVLVWTFPFTYSTAWSITAC